MDEIKKEMLTQDNRATSYVIFIVVEDKKVYGVESDWQDGRERKDIDYSDRGDVCDECQSEYEKSGEYPDECEECPDELFISYRIEKNVPNLYAGFFFTAKACDEHIKENAHHYNSTVKSYGISAYHNEELKTVMRHIIGFENISKIT